MIVCICNPTSNTEILNCISKYSSLKDLMQSLNICTTCGMCSKEIKSIWDGFYSSRLV